MLDHQRWSGKPREGDDMALHGFGASPRASINSKYWHWIAAGPVVDHVVATVSIIDKLRATEARKTESQAEERW
jgi:hypothetical protein